MLSFKEGKPFARIIGGSQNNKILRIYCDDKKPVVNDDVNLSEKKLSGLNKNELEILKDSYENNNDKMLKGKLKRIYNKSKSNGIGIGREINLEDGVMTIVPTDDPNQVDFIYITGPSGSGKSTFIGDFAHQYLKAFPSRRIILFSAKKEDEVLDKYRPIRILPTMNLVNDPIKLEELEDSLCIFDDCDTIEDRKVQEYIHKLRDKLLEEARSKRVSVCTVSHQITNYKNSRISLNEADYVIFFPKSGARYQVNYYLKNYAGLDKEQIKKVFELPSRWACLKKKYPLAIIHQSGAFLL